MADREQAPQPQMPALFFLIKGLFFYSELAFNTLVETNRLETDMTLKELIAHLTALGLDLDAKVLVRDQNCLVWFAEPDNFVREGDAIVIDFAEIAKVP